MALTLSAITLNSADPRRTAAFWADALGGSWRDGGNGYLHVLGEQVLLIVQPAADRVTGPTDVHLDLRADDPGRRWRGWSPSGPRWSRSARTRTGRGPCCVTRTAGSSAWREVVLVHGGEIEPRPRDRPLHRSISRGKVDLGAGRSRAGRMGARRVSRRRRGGLAERPKATVLKTVDAGQPRIQGFESLVLRRYVLSPGRARRPGSR